ncbi:MAG: hypothetical protein O3C27_03045 [Actinomycetota bacterium]|nr:hypothetical protein [Actinomycetota bacterium]
MNYDDVIAVAFQASPPEAVSPPTREPSPARRFRDAIEPLAMHAVWSRTTVEALTALGLDFFTGYVWGRAAALGNPSPGVVVSSFAVFEPSLLTGAYERARASADRAAVLDARTTATIASLEAALGIGRDDPSLRWMANTLRTATSSAHTAGKPLYSGLLDQDWPSSHLGTIWHACELAREHRGDTHIAVCVQRGLDPAEMNILTELWVGYPFGTYSASRAWSTEVLDAAAHRLRDRGLIEDASVPVELSAEGRAFRGEIERDTDQLQYPIIDALGPDTAAVVQQLDNWSQQCIAARSFPPNVYKRAAG